MKDIRRKIDLYILSLGLLFVFFLIIATKPPVNPFRASELESWEMLVMSNLPSIASLFFLFYCLFAYCKLDFDLKGATEIPFEISKLENINYEHLTFLATYVVPLISFNFENNRQLIVLALLLVVMGIIYVKTDLFYTNPSLSLIGFRIYRANGHFKDGERERIILICRGQLAEKQKVSYIRMDDRIYYVKRMA